MSDLTICKLSDCSASVAGGKEIILLCEKVAKEDIQIRFYEERDGDLFWEALGDFQPTQVHKQVAISFRTPKYKNIDVEKPVKVWVQLRRPSDGAVSENVPFQFVPLDSGRATFWSLRRVLSKKGDYNTFSKILNENAFLTPETQKRKLDCITPLVVDEFCEGKKPLLERPDFANKKDSLISGGSLVVVPNQNRLDLANDSSLLNSKKDDVEVVKLSAMDTSQNTFLKAQEEIKTISNKSINEATDKKIDELFVPTEGNQYCKEKMKEVRRTSEPNENSQSFNDLITQVAELDEIYAETQERLILSHAELESQLEDITMDCRESFRDNQTYSSLQLAMKNPVEPLENRSYEDVPVVHGPVIDIVRGRDIRKTDVEEKLPPLPPKRVKKTPPRRPDDYIVTKDLPKIPETGKTKQSLFQRLFSKNKTHSSPKIKASQSSESLKYSEQKSPTSGDSKSNCDVREIIGNEKSNTKWFHQSSSTGNLADESSALIGSPVKENVNIKTKIEKTDKESENYLLTKDDLELGFDLTEAENYALYTTLAPHASMTELDEISFYYSPVEKGKILTQDGMEHKLKETELKCIVRSDNVT